MKKKLGTPPFNPILTGKWANFKYIPERLIMWFNIFAWAPNSQKYEESNEEKKFGDPLYPPKKAYFGRTKPKQAVSPRRVCVTFLKFYRGC